MAFRPQILVFERDADLREFLKRVISPRYEVKTASKLSKVDKWLVRNHIDLLVADLSPSPLSTLRFIERLHGSPNHSGVCLVVLSAYPDLIERVSAARVDAVLPKPFRPGELRQVIGELLPLRTGHSI